MSRCVSLHPRTRAIDILPWLLAHHFICEDAVELLLAEGDQPVHADVLILAQRVLEQERDLQELQPGLSREGPASITIERNCSLPLS